MKDCNFRLLVEDAKHAVILIKYVSLLIAWNKIYSFSHRLTLTFHKFDRVFDRVLEKRETKQQHNCWLIVINYIYITVDSQ